MGGTPIFVILVTCYLITENFGRKPKWYVCSIRTNFKGWDWKFVAQKMSYGRKLKFGGSEISEIIDIQTRKLYFKVSLYFLGRSERSQRMETKVLHRISTRVSWAKWFALGSHFQKCACFDLDSKFPCSFFQEQVPKTCSFGMRCT